MSLRKPKSLKTGDKVAIVSTARKISRDELQQAILEIESWGLEVVLGKTVGLQQNQFAGTDRERATDFQKMLDDHSVKAIICARGGYGTVRILDYLDFTKFSLQPKWIIGYSDVTALHTVINCFIGVQTIHGTMPISFQTNTMEAIKSIKNNLFNQSKSVTFPTNKLNTKGNISGEIIGGNLSILYSILGTKSGFNADGKILFIEDLDEYLYHIDRMIVALKRAGKFAKLKGLIVGGMSDMNDNPIPFGKTANEIIAEHTAEYNFPICYNFPAGHIKDNQALVFGKTANLLIDENNCTLKYV